MLCVEERDGGLSVVSLPRSVEIVQRQTGQTESHLFRTVLTQRQIVGSRSHYGWSGRERLTLGDSQMGGGRRGRLFGLYGWMERRIIGRLEGGLRIRLWIGFEIGIWLGFWLGLRLRMGLGREESWGRERDCLGFERRGWWRVGS